MDQQQIAHLGPLLKFNAYLTNGVCSQQNCNLIDEHYHCLYPGCDFVYELESGADGYLLGMSEHVHCNFWLPDGNICQLTEFHYHCNFRDEFDDVCLLTDKHVHCEICDKGGDDQKYLSEEHYHCQICQGHVIPGQIHGHCQYCQEMYHDVEHRYCQYCQKCVAGEKSQSHVYCEACQKCYDKFHQHCDYCTEVKESELHAYCETCKKCNSDYYHQHCQHIYPDLEECSKTTRHKHCQLDCNLRHEHRHCEECEKIIKTVPREYHQHCEHIEKDEKGQEKPCDRTDFHVHREGGVYDYKFYDDEDFNFDFCQIL